MRTGFLAVRVLLVLRAAIGGVGERSAAELPRTPRPAAEVRRTARSPGADRGCWRSRTGLLGAGVPTGLPGRVLAPRSDDVSSLTPLG
jgi:hypothetical protein